MRLRLSLILCLALAVVVLPTILAAFAAGNQHIFAGFLLNPIDGNSYLAKMYQGWRGEWRFTLPFTAEPGNGGFLFLFYVFLGHVARWCNLSLVVVFHMARSLALILLGLALNQFLNTYLPDAERPNLIFFLWLFGSGLGWLLFPFGILTSDFWVAETYPFLSAYANPHFPLGLAIMLWLYILAHYRFQGNFSPSGRNSYGNLIAVLLALLLGLIAPFGVGIVLLVLGGLTLWDAWENHTILKTKGWRAFFLVPRITGIIQLAVCVGLGGAPVLIYDFVVAYSDPVLAGWNAQNLTPSPALWDLILSLSPALLLALAGGWFILKTRIKAARLLVVWCGLGVLLLYLPFGLQRRFMMGLFVPVVALAGYGLTYLRRRGAKRVGLISSLLVYLSLPTNLLLLLLAVFGVRTLDPLYYLTLTESQAFDWIEINTKPDALILAGPETGLFIPGQTGRRVIYGHPYETVNADDEEQAVIDFFEASDSAFRDEFLTKYKVDYVFFGPRERLLGDYAESNLMQRIYSIDDVEIYLVAGR